MLIPNLKTKLKRSAPIKSYRITTDPMRTEIVQ